MATGLAMIKKCVKCGLPETYETIEFDAVGVCNICRQKVYKDATIDWAARKVALNALSVVDWII